MIPPRRKTPVTLSRIAGINVSNKLWSIVLFFLVSGLIGCGGAVTAPAPTDPVTPTKVIPVFKPIPTATPYRFATTLPRSALEENTIEADDNFFFPAVLTVTVGSPVRWMHVGDVAHNVEAENRTWGTPVFSTGGTFDYVFTKEGVYAYVCTFHAPGMRGAIIVIKK
jgi:plastocyanin